jgi:regulator of replication initiation timing
MDGNAVMAMLETHKNVLLDLKKRVDAADKQIRELTIENRKISKENQRLSSILGQLRSGNEKPTRGRSRSQPQKKSW